MGPPFTREILSAPNDTTLADKIKLGGGLQFRIFNTSWPKLIQRWRSWGLLWAITTLRILNIIKYWKSSSLLSRSFYACPVVMQRKSFCRLTLIDWRKPSISRLVWRCMSPQGVQIVSSYTNNLTTSLSLMAEDLAQPLWVILALFLRSDSRHFQLISNRPYKIITMLTRVII